MALVIDDYWLCSLDVGHKGNWSLEPNSNKDAEGGDRVRRRKLDQIHGRIKPYLIPIEHSLYDIPKRLEEIDSDLFVCLNTKTQRFEVHSLGNKGTTFCFSVPYDELDVRTIEVFRRSNLKTRSIKEIIWEMDRENELRERRNEARRRSEINAWAREHRSEFKKAAEEVY